MDLKLVLRPIDTLGIGVLVVILGTILIALNFSYIDILPSLRYWDSTDYVEPDNIGKTAIGFISRDHIFVGKIHVWDDRKIFVSIEDSSGNMVFSPVLVDGSYSFVFQAPKDDYYYFYFDNTYSPLGSSSYLYKMVDWQVYYYGNYALIFQISTSILWTSGIVCIGSYLLKGKGQMRITKDLPKLSEEIIKKILRTKS